MDVRPTLACCQVADEEGLEEEAEQFDCEHCALSLAQADLWPENAEAWRVFQGLASRLLVDWHLGPEVLRRLSEDFGPESFRDLMERLTVVYDLIYPPPPEKH